MEASILGTSALAAEIAAVSGRNEDFVAAARADASRDVLALGLAGLGLAPEDSIRMLLRTGDAVARDSVALGALVELLRETNSSQADVILAAIWPARDGERAGVRAGGQHVPAMAPGGTPSRASAASGALRKPADAQLVDRMRKQR